MGKKKSKIKFDPPPPIDWSVDTSQVEQMNRMKSQLPAGFDPSQMDPAQIAQVQGLFKKLPRPQLQRLQSIMQKAMAGKDVASEFEDFEKGLTPEMKEAFAQMSQQFGGNEEAAAPAKEEDMSVEDARKIVEQAVKEGRLTPEQAEELLNKK